MKLYEHQEKGLKEVEDRDHVAFYWDMGLGKTFAGSEKMAQLGEKVNLVVCQKSKIQDWHDHFKEHYRWKIYDLTKPSELAEYCGLAMGERFTVVGIINYDLIWRRTELFNLKNFTLLLDESSLIQNEAAKRSKAILGLHARNVILLSGTPTGGKYERLWSQMHLLGWNISKELYWKQFVKVEYLDMVGKSIPVVVGYKNVERLKRKMAEYGCQFLKSDEVFDLPSQNFQMIKIPATKEYKQFHRDKIITIGDAELVGDTTLKRMLYERQLCGQYSPEKLKAFTDLVQSTDDRLVVFYNFNDELDQILAICEEAGRPTNVVNGKIKEHWNYLNKSDSITIVQYQAGAYGLNLQKARRLIYFTLPLSSELYEQSKKRIHRIGQDKPCFYYLLIVKGSIEEKILATLNMRKDYTEALFEKDDHD